MFFLSLRVSRSRLDGGQLDDRRPIPIFIFANGVPPAHIHVQGVLICRLRELGACTQQQVFGVGVGLPRKPRRTKHAYLTMQQLLGLAEVSGKYKLLVLLLGLTGLRWVSVTTPCPHFFKNLVKKTKKARTE